MMEEEKKDLRKEGKPDTEEKSAGNGLALGLCLGLAIGAGIGVATKNMGLWIPIGLCMGLSLGMSFDSQKKKRNEQDNGDDQPQA